MQSTLTAVAHFAAKADGRTAVRSDDTCWSYADLHDTARAVARNLIDHDVRVVGLAADNGPEWLAVDLAAQMCDAVLVPLPAFFSEEQIRHALADSGADAVIGDARRVLGPRRESSERGVGGDLIGGLRITRLRNAAPAELPPSTAKISYTSGTTAQPKGVCLTRDGMDTVASSLREALADLHLQRHLCALPLATLLENVAGVYAPLQKGAEVIVPSLQDVGVVGATQFDPLRLLRTIGAYEAESLILLPQMLAALIAAIERGAALPASVRFIAVGGARVASALLERAERLRLPVYEGYGLTECGSVAALNTPAARRAGSVGRPLPHVRVDVDARGEIHVSGPSVCGYVGGSHVPSRLATGDLGHLDDDGFLHVDGRRKNVFITSFGRNVSPEWVETELTAESGIAQAAVFGEARPWNVAVIVARSAAASPAETEAAIDRVNERLPDYARVGEWFYAEEPFTHPNGLLTANGRNRRAAIWGRYAARVNAVYDRAVERIA
jgi:long-subunit acyl-CoA synthetase (AMP-forming)